MLRLCNGVVNCNLNHVSKQANAGCVVIGRNEDLGLS